MAIPARHLAATSVAFLAALAASPQATACIASPPAVQRTHSILLAGSSGGAPRHLRQMDLASIVLPAGSEDDWRATLVESRPGTLRLLSPQEWERILGSPGAATTTATGVSGCWRDARSRSLPWRSPTRWLASHGRF